MLKNTYRGSKKKIWVLGIVTGLLIPYGAVMGITQASAAPNTLNIISAEPTTGFDPAIAKTQASLRVMELIYDGLVDYNSAGVIVPGIAESWKSSNGGLTLTFKIRSNAKFYVGPSQTQFISQDCSHFVCSTHRYS
jgi:ABC-type transport system substrate-binding protein